MSGSIVVDLAPGNYLPTFTPGPWEICWGQEARIGIDNADGGPRVAEVLSTVEQRGRHTANAYLIAAAPDLFEALEALVGFARSNAAPGQAYVDDAEAALAKARGETA